MCTVASLARDTRLRVLAANAVAVDIQPVVVVADDGHGAGEEWAVSAPALTVVVARIWSQTRAAVGWSL
jgi:hypothetical protein